MVDRHRRQLLCRKRGERTEARGGFESGEREMRGEPTGFRREAERGEAAIEIGGEPLQYLGPINHAHPQHPRSGWVGKCPESRQRHALLSMACCNCRAYPRNGPEKVWGSGAQEFERDVLILPWDPTRRRERSLQLSCELLDARQVKSVYVGGNEQP
jgi:hypothetical protein